MIDRIIRWALLPLALSISPVWAQTPSCAPLAPLLQALEEGPKETPVYRGADERGFLTLLTLSPDGSYTVLVVNPQSRTACIVSTGSGWEHVEHSLSGRGT